MNISRHFLVPFLGIVFLGGAAFIFSARSGSTNVEQVTRQPMQPAPGNLAQDSLEPSMPPEKSRAFTGTEDSSLATVAFDTTPNEATSGPQRNGASAIVEVPAPEANYSLVNSRSLADSTQSQSLAASATAAAQTAQPAINPSLDPQSSGVTPGGVPRRQGFTVEEQWYRAWHGWASIDAYREAQSNGSH